jgi:phage tail sheath protein FI
MANVYKTPGVYVEEISTLPASIAQVETAIPAFIGYTEKAELTDGKSLTNKPFRISSLVEFRLYYGGPAPLNINSVSMNDKLEVTAVTMDQQFYLFDSLQMFFKNGGADCYIVSVGNYTDTISNGDDSDPENQPGFAVGLKALEKADEPTMILFPDASVSNIDYGSTDMYTLQKSTLAHCAYMQDRFGIFDLTDSGVIKTDRDNFRAGIGMNDLKYGAAYYPWLKVPLNREVKYNDVKDSFIKNGSPITVEDMTVDADGNFDQEAKDTAIRLEAINNDVNNITTNLGALLAADNSKTLRDLFNTKYEAYRSASTEATKRAGLVALFEYYWDLIYLVDGWIDVNPTGATPFEDTGGDNEKFLLEYSQTFVSSTFATTAQLLLEYDIEADSEVDSGNVFPVYNKNSRTWDSAQWGGIFVSPTSSTDIFTGADNLAKMTAGQGEMAEIFELIIAGINLIQNKANDLLATVDSNAQIQIPPYKNALAAVRKSLIKLPPSGAMAGIYAYVDRTRGVWKAPANVSLNGVVDLTQTIENREQENLNVDVTGGKSINCIRAFTGKGILVWGARTLAGNDNEWRYVPVRRLFIMIEESIKKATEFVVFEPNDANTWVRVKGMINNFLTEMWKVGALAGAKPEHAFFVNCGLGETMTSQDILEGKLIVEIGLAAVRPAEFIILRFSHKLQES